MPFPSLKLGPLAKRKTQEFRPFQVIGVDYVCPIYYIQKQGNIKVVYYYYYYCVVFPELFT